MKERKTRGSRIHPDSIGVVEKFDKHAELYDKEVRNKLPQYDELRKVLFDFVPFSKEAKINVLELGVGTGTTATEFLKRYPNARLIGVDFSSKMIDQSRQKLEQYKSRIELVQADFRTLQPTEQIDLVYSILTVDHVPPKDKEALFRKIYAILHPGGAFVLIDLANGAGDQQTNHHQNNELSFKEQGSTSSVMEYIELLQKAGFKTTDVAWKQNRLACLIALKTK